MKDYLTHLICLITLAIISVTYFYPVLSNKSIQQSDISQFKGMSKQIVDHRESFNEEPYWLDNAFLGMPSYQVSAKYPFDLLYYIDQTIRFLPSPADYLFLYLISKNDLFFRMPSGKFIIMLVLVFQLLKLHLFRDLQSQSIFRHRLYL